MSDKIISIISTSDVGKARTGVMYTVNAKKQQWLKDVKLYFFGPSEQLLLKDEVIQGMLKEYLQLEQSVVACKAIADRDGISREISELGIQVEFVGKMISDLIKQDYTPMVW